MTGYGIPHFLHGGLSDAIYLRMVESDWLPWSIDEAAMVKPSRGIGIPDAKLSRQEIKKRYALALPQFQCCRRYCMHNFPGEEQDSFISSIIISRENFAEQFGKEAIIRTIAFLALTGRPCLYVSALNQEY